MRQFTRLILPFALTFAGPARADDAAEVKAILDKAVKAVGGAEKAAKLDAVNLKGKAMISEGGMDLIFNLDLSVQGFDRMRMDVNATIMGMQKKATLVLVGDNGWARDSDKDKTEEAPKEVIAILQQFMFALRSVGHPAGLGELKDVKLAAGGVGTVGEVETILLRISRKDRPEITIHFDKKSGLPLKCETRMKFPDDGEEKSVEFQFSDFKEFGGVKSFGRVKLTREGKDLAEVEVTEGKVGEKFEANTFEKP